LKGLDFLLDIKAGGFVLHHQYAQCDPLPQHGHTEEGLVDLFARLRLVREGRMGLGMGEIERFRPLGNQANKTLAGTHRGLMDRFARQTFGGIEF
jgi:hypothetical protein